MAVCIFTAAAADQLSHISLATPAPPCICPLRISAATPGQLHALFYQSSTVCRHFPSASSTDAASTQRASPQSRHWRRCIPSTVHVLSPRLSRSIRTRVRPRHAPTCAPRQMSLQHAAAASVQAAAPAPATPLDDAARRRLSHRAWSAALPFTFFDRSRSGERLRTGTGTAAFVRECHRLWRSELARGGGCWNHAQQG